jgi:tetratricopeptide (TPR) repeat protein
MGDKLLEIQNQIRNNASSIHDYMSDLSSWEAEINQIDSSLAGKALETPSGLPPVRSSVVIDEKPKNTVLKRDKTDMKDYYKAWERFDVESELEKSEDPKPVLIPPTIAANPQSKIIVKGGKSVNSEIDRLKDQGNLEFASKNYNKALDKYQECLIKDVPADIKLILYSNSAECYLRLKSPDQALDQAEKALNIDPKHIKSLLRRAKAKKMLGKYRNSRSDLEECLKLDPSNPTVKQELLKLDKKRKLLLEETKSKMISKSRIPPSDLVSVPVIETNSNTTEDPKDITNLKEHTNKAIQSIQIDQLPLPKNLVELERNWIMLTDISKLKAYLNSIPMEQVYAMFQKNIETDFLMRVVNTFLNYFVNFQDICLDYLTAVAANKKISVLVKFITKKEKEKIQELLNLLGNPVGFDMFR